MACKCIEKINAELKRAKTNTELEVPVCLNLIAGKISASTCVVATVKIDSHIRGKAKTVFAAYCPFCGKRYERQKRKTKQRTA